MIFGFVLGLVVGWTLCKQPESIKAYTDAVVAWVKAKLKL